jgi:Tesmin/TSO1-like CXC domain, cysteine-rich domain
LDITESQISLDDSPHDAKNELGTFHFEESTSFDVRLSQTNADHHENHFNSSDSFFSQSVLLKNQNSELDFESVVQLDDHMYDKMNITHDDSIHSVQMKAVEVSNIDDSELIDRKSIRSRPSRTKTVSTIPSSQSRSSDVVVSLRKFSMETDDDANNRINYTPPRKKMVKGMNSTTSKHQKIDSNKPTLNSPSSSLKVVSAAFNRDKMGTTSSDSSTLAGFLVISSPKKKSGINSPSKFVLTIEPSTDPSFVIDDQSSTPVKLSLSPSPNSEAYAYRQLEKLVSSNTTARASPKISLMEPAPSPPALADADQIGFEVSSSKLLASNFVTTDGLKKKAMKEKSVRKKKSSAAIVSKIGSLSTSPSLFATPHPSAFTSGGNQRSSSPGASSLYSESSRARTPISVHGAVSPGLGVRGASAIAGSAVNTRSSSTPICCNCVKSHCSKNYCLCFAANGLCGSQCKCKDCSNKFNPLLHAASASPLPMGKTNGKRKKSSSPLEFSPAPAAPAINVVIVCKCPKSKCLLEYCVCFKSRITCSNGCACKDCHNKESDAGKNEFPAPPSKKRSL